VVAGYGRGGEEEEAEQCPVPCGGGGRRHTAACGAAGRAMALGRREPNVGDKAGGPDRAGLGHAGWVATSPKGFFGLKMREKGKRAAGLFFNFTNKDLILKGKDSNTFKLNLNFNQTGIN
jgi:hypothetical protein